MPMPVRTQTAAEVFPTGTSPSLADAQTWLAEADAALTWLGGRILRLSTAVHTTSIALSADESDALGIDGATLVIVDTLTGNTTITLPFADAMVAAGGASAPVTFLRRDGSTNTLSVACQSGDTIDGVTAWTAFPLAKSGDRATIRAAEDDTWALVSAAIQPTRELVTVTEASRSVPAGARDVSVAHVGGSGGSGGADGTGTAQFNGGSGGGGGGAESRFILDVRTLSTLALTIGAAGAAGADTAGNGGDGGTTEVTWSGAANKVTSGGGEGGRGANAANGLITRGGAGGTPSTTGSMTLVRGLVQRAGQPGSHGISMRDAGAQALGGAGGSSSYGGAGAEQVSAGSVGNAATGYGAGPGGSVATVATGANVAGRIGRQGVIELTWHWLTAA